MQSMLSASFPTLAHRVLYSIHGAFVPFAPIPDATAPESAQRDFYNFLQDLITALYSDPSLLSLPADKDESEDSPADGKGYLDTRKLMRKIAKPVEDMYAVIHYIGTNSALKDGALTIDAKQAKLNKSRIALLEHVGISCKTQDGICTISSAKYPQIAEGWVAACAAQSNLSMLARGILAPNDDVILNLFVELTKQQGSDISPYLPYLRENLAFTYKINFEISEIHFKNSVSGFIIHFDRRFFHQMDYGIMNHINFKKILVDFEILDEHFRDFIVKACRGCTNCRACTKGNEKVDVYVRPAWHRGVDYALCPSFPQFGWKNMDADLMRDVVMCIELQEKYGAK